MKTLLLISGLMFVLTSCTDSQKVTASEKLFDVSYQELNSDTTFTNRDSNSSQLNKKSEFYGTRFLEDSLYQIYGCCAGEFGGSLFFYSKTDKKLFFYPSGCVDQVIYYRGSYYVFENLYSADYLRIPNPEKLIELTYNDRLFGCNWWTGVDSLKKYYSGDLDTAFAGLPRYRSNWREHSLGSFVLNDTLFTIVSSDSSTYLAIHQGDSLYQVQKLLDKEIWFHHTDIYKKNDSLFVTFSASSTQWDSETKAASDLTNSGFIIVEGRTIKIAEHPTKRNYIKE